MLRLALRLGYSLGNRNRCGHFHSAKVAHAGAGDPRCKLCIFMGKTNPSAKAYNQQSMLLVPMDAPGITVLRPLEVYGFDDAPHGHMEVSIPTWLSSKLMWDTRSSSKMCV